MKFVGFTWLCRVFGFMGAMSRRCCNRRPDGTLSLDASMWPRLVNMRKKRRDGTCVENLLWRLKNQTGLECGIRSSRTQALHHWFAKRQDLYAPVEYSGPNVLHELNRYRLFGLAPFALRE